MFTNIRMRNGSSSRRISISPKHGATVAQELSCDSHQREKYESDYAVLGAWTAREILDEVVSAGSIFVATNRRRFRRELFRRQIAEQCA
jgi:hypothetical protein